MKTTLLSVFSLISFGAFAQQPVNFFDEEWSAYTIVTSATEVDQSAIGENVVWNFSTLVDIGTSDSRFIDSTPAEITAFPNTTKTLLTSGTINGEAYENRIFTRSSGATAIITGTGTTEMVLRYNTDNASLGNFPKNYGDTFTDDTAGNFESVEGGYFGTFTGTITTSIDAYGTLSANIGNFDAGTAVTRLKTDQDIQLFYGFLGQVGTVHQTTYSYYSDELNIPIFRSTRTEINVPILDVDYDSTSMESFAAVLLSTPTAQFAKAEIAPNPADNILNIKSESNNIIRNISITDSFGRTVRQIENPANSISIDGLQSGIYFVNLSSANGNITKKLIKK